MHINNIATKTWTGSNGLIYEGPVLFFGMLLGTDALNDPTVTLYDSTGEYGKEIVPSNQYDASVLGLNGVMPGCGVYCENGLYVSVSTSGTCEVTIYMTPHFD